jgi:hypothetical protein
MSHLLLSLTPSCVERYIQYVVQTVQVGTPSCVVLVPQGRVIKYNLEVAFAVGIEIPRSSGFG